jgi:peroxiredoxin
MKDDDPAAPAGVCFHPSRGVCMPRHTAALLVALFLLSPVFADEPTPAVKPGQTIPDFSLKDASGKSWSLGECKDRKAFVVLFLGTECPINNAYLPRLAEMYKTFDAKGVQFFAINPNCHDTPARIAQHSKENKIPFPVLKGIGNTVTDQFGARRTPEAFVLDADRKLRYRGRIDDQFGIGYKRNEPTRKDLEVALEEVLAGKSVSVTETPVAGCLIARAVTPKTKGAITYTKHVSRILQQHCQECHRPEQIGPMPLLTYDDAVAWSAMIHEVVSEKRMPPWHAEGMHGKFSNERGLSKDERDTLLGWIDGGLVKGEDSDLPAAREFPKGWRIGKPDAVFEMKEEAAVPAKAEQAYLRYRYYTVDPGFTEDKWIQGAEARPGNRAVVHHIIVYILGPNQRRPAEGTDGIGSGFLTAYAPGDMPSLCPPGAAKKIPKGSRLLFQMHYTPTEVEHKDRSSIGLIYAKEAPKYEVKTRAIANRFITLRPGEDDQKFALASTFWDDSIVCSLMPHMHLRGKAFEYHAVYPDGKKELLLRVPKYDFNWQSNYRLKEPLKLPAGAKIECTAWYDNSKNNPNNPDPSKWVRWGDQTFEEMMIGFVDYVSVPVEK